MPVSKLLVYGHSYAAGSGETTGENRVSSQLARALKVTETNRAVGASALCADNYAAADPGAPWPQTGGWVHVMQTHTPVRTRAPYLSPVQVIVLYHGLNDLALVGIQNLAATFKPALHAVIDRLRAGAVFEDNHATVTYAGTWATITNSTLGSGIGNHYTSTSGASVTIAVPSDFPGGTITAGTTGVAGIPGSEHVGANLRAREAGTLLAETSTFNLGESSQYAPATLRINELAAGPHQITVTFENVVGNNFFDYWEIEANPAPLVVVPLANELLSYTAHGTGWPFQVDSEDIAALNVAVTEVASEYAAGRVLAVPTDDVMAGSWANFQADGVHPNAQGAALIAHRLYEAITQAVQADTRSALLTGVA